MPFPVPLNYFDEGDLMTTVSRSTSHTDTTEFLAQLDIDAVVKFYEAFDRLEDAPS